MSVTVHEVLSLKKFNEFRLIAGANGLDRKVTAGGFIDHESPEDMINDDFRNEMVFSNLPMIKDKPEMITVYLQAIIDANCACFAVKTTFFKELPESAIELANKNNFPLMLFDDTYIEKLLIEIDEAVNSQKQIGKKLSIVKELESGELNQQKIKSYAYELNRHFKKNILACYIKQSENSLYRFDLKLAQTIIGKASIVFPIQDSFLLILSYNDTEIIDIKSLIDSIGIVGGDYHVGISDYKAQINEIDKVLHQSKAALKFACFKDELLVDFKDIGIYKMLMPIIDNVFVTQYYEEIIKTIVDYDEKHKSDLLSTACEYIHCDGDINATSLKLFQHTNTVRYRIKKIKELLELYKLDGMKYETLSLAIHLYEINKNRYKFNQL